MRHSILRWTIYLLCLMVLGPIAGTLTGGLRGTDGGPAATALVGANPAAGLVAALVAMGIALVVGVVAALLLGVGPGMSSAGLILAWTTWRTGTVDQLIRTSHSGQPLLWLAVEGLIFGLLGLALAYALWVAGRGELLFEARKAAAPTDATGARSRSAAMGILNLFQGKGAPIAMAVGIFAGAVAAWFIGVTPLKGQALAAAIAAGTLAAAAGRLVEYGTPMPTLFLAIAALAVLGPLSGVATAGTGMGAVQASYAGRLFPLANICPLDWIAGGLLGIPLGVAWAGSMIEKRTDHG